MLNALQKSIIHWLENYLRTERQIELLESELKSIGSISQDDLLEALAFAKGENHCAPEGNVSDKTARVAISYRNAAEIARKETRSAVLNELLPLKAQKERLDRCIHHLSPIHKSVLTGIYIHHRSYKDLASEMHLSERTIQRYRDNAIDELVSLYEYLEKLGVITL